MKMLANYYDNKNEGQESSPDQQCESPTQKQEESQNIEHDKDKLNQLVGMSYAQGMDVDAQDKSYSKGEYRNQEEEVAFNDGIEDQEEAQRDEKSERQNERQSVQEERFMGNSTLNYRDFLQNTVKFKKVVDFSQFYNKNPDDNEDKY